MMNQTATDKFEVAIASLGGQGSLLLGKLLAEAGLTVYKNVTYFPNYGAAMRGGSSECTVILTNSDFSNSPISLEIEAGIVMDKSFVDQYQEMVRPGGMLFLDSTTITQKVERDDIKVFYIPATQTAVDLGDKRVANIVFMGAYLEVTKAMGIEVIVEALKKRLGPGKEALLELNKKALAEGARLAAA